MPSHPTPLDLLLGTWHLTRDIPGHAFAHGQATVHRLTPDQARYDEHVTLRLLSGPTLQASAAYLFQQRPDIPHLADGVDRRQTPHTRHRQEYSEPSILDVLFPHTGQLFHRLHFAPDSTGTLLANATHRCAADIYLSTYHLDPCGRTVHIEHRVHGPSKNYTSRTTLTRA